MAWNPAPEVAVARDAAKELGNVPIVAILYITDDGKLGIATYGRTMKLCALAKNFGEHLWNAAGEFDPEQKGRTQ